MKIMSAARLVNSLQYVSHNDQTSLDCIRYQWWLYRLVISAYICVYIMKQIYLIIVVVEVLVDY